MSELTINDLLSSFDQLTNTEKEYFLDIVQKKFTEIRRNEIADRVKEAEQNYKNGNVKVGDSNQLLNDLEND